MNRAADLARSRRLVRRFALVILATLLALGARLVQLHVAGHDQALDRVAELTRRTRVLPARRGDLLDRHGRILATTESRLLVDFWPPKLEQAYPHPGERVRAARRLAAALAPFVGREPELLVEHMFARGNQRLGDPVVDPDAQRELLEDPADVFALLDLRLEERRRYPWGAVAGNLLGYLDPEGTGVEGLERGLDDLLSGRDGERVARVDQGNRELVHLDERRVPAVHGLDVTLSVDVVIQKMLREELLAVCEEQEAERAVGVVVDSRSGELLALGSVPGIDPDDRSSLTDEGTIHGGWREVYAPGSTFKPLMMAAALDLGLTHPHEPPIDCSTHDFRPTKDTHPQDHPLTLEEILVHSSNIGIGKLLTRITPKDRQRDTEAMAPLHALLGRLGLGRVTGLPLRSESPGFYRPLAKWDRDWTVASLSRGQQLALTPIQMAAAANALTDGLYRPPVLVRALSRDGGRPEPVAAPIPTPVFSQDTAELVSGFLREVVVRGKTPEVRDSGLSVGGKTGTADLEDRLGSGDEVHSFVALCPAEDPQITVLVAVRVPRHARYASQSAAPVAGRLLRRLAPYLGLHVEESAG